MGGHAGGQIASKYAVEDFVGFIASSEEANPIAALNEAVSFVNSQIKNSSAHTMYEGMGTQFDPKLVKSFVSLTDRGEIKVALHNDGEVARVVTPAEKIAQLVVVPFLSVSFNEVDKLNDTDRGEGGFGSTGKH